MQSFVGNSIFLLQNLKFIWNFQVYLDNFQNFKNRLRLFLGRPWPGPMRKKKPPPLVKRFSYLLSLLLFCEPWDTNIKVFSYYKFLIYKTTHKSRVCSNLFWSNKITEVIKFSAHKMARRKNKAVMIFNQKLRTAQWKSCFFNWWKNCIFAIMNSHYAMRQARGFLLPPIVTSLPARSVLKLHFVEFLKRNEFHLEDLTVKHSMFIQMCRVDFCGFIRRAHEECWRFFK